MKIKRALVSVSDKREIVDFVRELHKMEIEIISTGGTARAIRKAGLEAREVAEATGFPEVLGGRVKTLHPLIHGGILADRDKTEHMKAVRDRNIPLIDLVVVNLYPFAEVVKKPNVSLEMAIENIDIGGPAMVRAAAKNHKHVAVVIDPEDYVRVAEQIRDTGGVDEKTRAELAVKVFLTTSRYDAAVDSYLSASMLSERRLHISYTNGQALRYGENSHQRALFFKNPDSRDSSAANGELLNGKAMSYNNYVDADAALETVKNLSPKMPAVSVIKHTNPCGLATGSTVGEALARAWEGDPISAFGSVIATNAPVDMEFAEFLKGDRVPHYSYQVVNGKYVPEEVSTGKFVEVILAPEFHEDAVDFLKKKSGTIRLLKVGPTAELETTACRSITGGLLMQDRDSRLIEKFEMVTERKFSDAFRALAEFTLVACKHTKSNGIVLGREYAPGRFQVVGMGAGQPNRVDSMRKLAVAKARENMRREYEKLGIAIDFEKWWQREVGKMVLASDGFFPFEDTAREAASFGIGHIVQPGGSKRDERTVEVCNELGVALAFTGLRHFSH